MKAFSFSLQWQLRRRNIKWYTSLHKFPSLRPFKIYGTMMGSRDFWILQALIPYCWWTLIRNVENMVKITTMTKKRLFSMQIIKTEGAKRLSSDVNYILAAVITNKYLSSFRQKLSGSPPAKCINSTSDATKEMFGLCFQKSQRARC